MADTWHSVPANAVASWMHIWDYGARESGNGASGLGVSEGWCYGKLLGTVPYVCCEAEWQEYANSRGPVIAAGSPCAMSV